MKSSWPDIYKMFRAVVFTLQTRFRFWTICSRHNQAESLKQCNSYVSLSLRPKPCREPCHGIDLQGRKQGSEHAREKPAILDRTTLHKHGTLSPESLHAKSQWGQPARVGQEDHRSDWVT